MLANIIKSPSGAPDDGFIQNTCMGALFVQSTLIFLETHSKRSYTICIILVILGELESFRQKLQGLQYYEPANTAVSPSSWPPVTFRQEKRLRLSDRNSILMT